MYVRRGHTLKPIATFESHRNPDVHKASSETSRLRDFESNRIVSKKQLDVVGGIYKLLLYMPVSDKRDCADVYNSNVNQNAAVYLSKERGKSVYRAVRGGDHRHRSWTGGAVRAG